MSSRFEGMVVSEVEGLGHLLTSQMPGKIEEVIHQVSGQLGSTNWVGSDRDRFEHDWQNQYIAQLNTIKHALSEFGQHALREATQQREASAN